jgi:arylsulfatase A-like enzyme
MNRLVLLLILTGGTIATAADKPNIVYIMADELGYYELGHMGNPNIRTPNLDRFAAEGIRFTQGLAGSSVCAPTRCCLMTGKHSGHTSVRSNGGGTPLRDGEPTVASILKPLGYATGGFGKWGCGGRGSTGVPEKHGFDVFLGYYDQVHAHSYYPPYIVRNSEEVPLGNNKGLSEGDTYSHYVIMNEGLQFIRDNKDRPFFAYFPITPPHGLFDIPDEDPAWALYRDREEWPEQARRYAAMVTMLDRNVGEVLSLLRELGLEKKTIVFFCGDNGGNNYFASKEFPRGVHGANKNPKTGVEFRGGKGNLYEGGLRIPMLARWPGKIAPGQVSDHLWYFPDVMATVAELTGAKAPGDHDGISIVPTLLGKDAAGRKQEKHQYLYWEIGQQIAVRMGNWKAIKPRQNAPWELYNLEKDVSETTDLSAQKPDLLKQMQGLAEEAHEPVITGTFHDSEIHERDRRAKFGGKAPPPRNKRPAKPAANTIPEEGLIPTGEWRVKRVTSENTGNQKYGRNAIDGDPDTIWHSKFSGGIEKHPHELVIDLGAERHITAFRYLPRQDGGWNGTIKDIEFAVSDDPDSFGKPVAAATLKKTKQASEIKCSQPAKGRYVLIRSTSEINDGPWTTVAELGVVGR